MDAKDELRRLLRQRLEDGESTIVLESLQASEIAAILAAAVVQGSSTALGGSSAKDSHPVRPDVPIPRVARDDNARETLDQRRAGPPEGAGDWRAALQATGVSPGPTPTEPPVSA